ncbi:MAG: Insertion element protein [Actinomycetota bacterium]|nr:Insertion element protein [Actinomycetota bacterium]
MSDARASAFFCPYCGEEDLRPVPEPHGAWRCADCLRTFAVKLIGVGVPPTQEVRTWA